MGSKGKRLNMKIQMEVKQATGAARNSEKAPRVHQAIVAALFTFAISVCLSTSANAQYFQMHEPNVKPRVIEAANSDSVLFTAMTPFALPKTNDTVQLTYHEPMPDSIMPRSAIVIGEVTLQASDPTVLVNKLEKFARQAGADWIVSFAEPRVFHDKAGNRLFRGTAQLLRVLDPTFIQQTDLQYSYFEENKLQNFAAVSGWYDTYGRHMGAKMDPVGER
jgi:hypothetical protein